LVRLFDPRHDLAAYGAPGIAGIHQVEKVRSDSESQFGVGEFRSLEFCIGYVGKIRFQVLQVVDAVLQLPLPVIPI
jgi:hypothetical protein